MRTINNHFTTTTIGFITKRPTNYLSLRHMEWRTRPLRMEGIIHQPMFDIVELKSHAIVEYYDNVIDNPVDYVNQNYIQSTASLNAELHQTRDLYLAQEGCDITSIANVNENQLMVQADMQENKQYIIGLYVDSRLEEIALFFKNRQEEQYVPKPRSEGFSLIHRPPAGGYSIRSVNNGNGGGNWGNGGGNWGNGGDNWDEGPPPHNYILLLMLGCICIVIGQYGYSLVREATEKLINKFFNSKTPDEDEPTPKVWFPSLIPALASGLVLVFLSYLLSPENLRAIMARCEAMAILIARGIGRILLQLIPPQLHEMALRLAAGIELVGAQIHYFLNGIFIPTILFVRSFTLLAIKLFFVLKCMALGLELYGWISNKIPPSVVSRAHDLVSSMSGSSTGVELFLMHFLKCLCVLLISFVPETLPLMVRCTLGLAIVVLIFLDPAQLGSVYLRKFAEFLMSYPMFAKLSSSIAGRWSLIVGTVFLVNNEPQFRKMSVVFLFGLYFFRVYELAMIVTPNFLP